MATEPLVYIVLVNWNGRQVTLDCLDSLQHLTYGNTSVVVVDNGSIDGSVDAIRQLYPSVLLLEMRKNLRFAAGTNAGVRFAMEHGAELILLLNNDTTVAGDFLTHLVARMQADPVTGLVAPKIYYHDEPSRIWFAGGIISMWTGTMRHIGIRESDTGQFNTARAIDYASGCCILARREVIEKVGTLDEAFFMYTEDADWCVRVRKAGYRIMYEPTARVWHKLSVSTGGHLSWYKMKNKFIGNFRLVARHAAWYQWLVFPWLNVLVNALAALKYLATTRKTPWN
jgi:GT2 family glycosyltransferase